MDKQDALKKLEALKLEHKLLEAQITEILEQKVIDHFQIQSIKKRKLILKEDIMKLQSLLLDDIIA